MGLRFFCLRQERFDSICRLKGGRGYSGKRGIGYRSGKVLNDVERVLGRSGYKVAISYKRLFKLIKIKSN